MNEKIQEVRVATQAGIMRCKAALVETDGDVKAAIELIRSRGEAIAENNFRPVNNGTIAVYLHANGQLGAMVEVACETDFVARNKDFTDFAHNLAMHVAATNPQFTEDDDEVFVLLKQEYVKDNSKKIHDLLVDIGVKFGEHIIIKRFTRMKVGE